MRNTRNTSREYFTLQFLLSREQFFCCEKCGLLEHHEIKPEKVKCVKGDKPNHLKFKILTSSSIIQIDYIN